MDGKIIQEVANSKNNLKIVLQEKITSSQTWTFDTMPSLMIVTLLANISVQGYTYVLDGWGNTSFTYTIKDDISVRSHSFTVDFTSNRIIFNYGSITAINVMFLG